ncbi:hypothetical protein [Actinokineospora sp.]|uniref:hypothetical protein n=1 Tax=Actinokineospora sp. TaxID=1872133 RepID=UPI003D6B12C0
MGLVPTTSSLRVADIRLSHKEVLGLHTCGSGSPVSAAVQPVLSADMAVLEVRPCTVTTAHLPPPNSRPAAL